MDTKKFIDILRNGDLTDNSYSSYSDCFIKSLSICKRKFNKILFVEDVIRYNIFDNCEFTGVDFTNTDLSNCKFCNCTFQSCFFPTTILKNILFISCTFDKTVFCNSQILYSEFLNAKFINCNMSWTILSNCSIFLSKFDNINFEGAILKSLSIKKSVFENCCFFASDFYNTDIKNTDFSKIRTSYRTKHFNTTCPLEGSFFGWKKSRGCLIKLMIPDDARRSSATTEKCRCDKAKVLSITKIETGEEIDSIRSSYDESFVYKVNETVEEPDFDDCWYHECAKGIHFFMTPEIALKYDN